MPVFRVRAAADPSRVPRRWPGQPPEHPLRGEWLGSGRERRTGAPGRRRPDRGGHPRLPGEPQRALPAARSPNSPSTSPRRAPTSRCTGCCCARAHPVVLRRRRPQGGRDRRHGRAARPDHRPPAGHRALPVPVVCRARRPGARRWPRAWSRRTTSSSAATTCTSRAHRGAPGPRRGGHLDPAAGPAQPARGIRLVPHRPPGGGGGGARAGPGHARRVRRRDGCRGRRRARRPARRGPPGPGRGQAAAHADLVAAFDERGDEMARLSGLLFHSEVAAGADGGGAAPLTARVAQQAPRHLTPSRELVGRAVARQGGADAVPPASPTSRQPPPSLDPPRVHSTRRTARSCRRTCSRRSRRPATRTRRARPGDARRRRRAAAEPPHRRRCAPTAPRHAAPARLAPGTHRRARSARSTTPSTAPPARHPRCAPRATPPPATGRSPRPTTGSARPGSCGRRPTAATRSTARACPWSPPCTSARDYDNAFWDGTQMVFGDGDGVIFLPFTRSVDVIGHELAHGVTQYTSGLNYQDQSGALNESVSDVFGVLVKQRLLGQTADQADWLVGAELLAPGVNGVALRSMAAPGTAYDDPRLGKDPQPGHMRDYVDTTDDNGGVHINSGIPNKAFHVARDDPRRQRLGGRRPGLGRHHHRRHQRRLRLRHLRPAHRRRRHGPARRRLRGGRRGARRLGCRGRHHRSPTAPSGPGTPTAAGAGCGGRGPRYGLRRDAGPGHRRSASAAPAGSPAAPSSAPSPWASCPTATPAPGTRCSPTTGCPRWPTRSPGGAPDARRLLLRRALRDAAARPRAARARAHRRRARLLERTLGTVRAADRPVLRSRP